MPNGDRHPPLEAMAATYWVESRQPLASLVFLAPLLAVYEAGVLLLGVQNGADAFMRRVLDLLGFGQHFLLPLLTIAILLGWHHLAHRSWRLSGGIVSAMAVESVLLALALRAVLFLQEALFHSLRPTLALGVVGTLKDAVGFLGAGIYEELLFRLILFSLVAWGLRTAGIVPWLSLLLAAVLTSLLFAAAHNVGANGEAFQWFSFIFRVLAGLFFSVLFVYRGFGIAAGAHAAYDILVGVFG